MECAPSLLRSGASTRSMGPRGSVRAVRIVPASRWVRAAPSAPCGLRAAPRVSFQPVDGSARLRPRRAASVPHLAYRSSRSMGPRGSVRAVRPPCRTSRIVPAGPQSRWVRAAPSAPCGLRAAPRVSFQPVDGSARLRPRRAASVPHLAYRSSRSMGPRGSVRAVRPPCRTSRIVSGAPPQHHSSRDRPAIVPRRGCANTTVSLCCDTRQIPTRTPGAGHENGQGQPALARPSFAKCG